MEYVCDVCSWDYNETYGNPDNGIVPGTKWSDVPEDFVCPQCGAEKGSFILR